MFEILKNALEKGGGAHSMLMHLSNAFGTVDHDFLIASIVAYGFEEDVLFFHEKLFNEKTTAILC